LLISILFCPVPENAAIRSYPDKRAESNSEWLTEGRSPGATRADGRKRQAQAQDVGAGARLATKPRGCSASANRVKLASMERPPTPTLEQLRRGTPWCWVVCENCMHPKPVAFVPFIIRWGPDASSDMLRRSARCTKCGRKGAALQHPSWAGMHIGFEPFPRS
jgi:hypothetical protein